MITKILIPTVDLRRANFDYGRNLSDEEAAAMEIDKFNRTDRQIGSYVDSMRYGNRSYMSDVRRQRRDFSNVIDDDEFLECEAFIGDSKKKEVFEDFFKSHMDGNKFIITLNINPNSLDQEAESEIRYWRDDSNGVLNDRFLDNQTKIERLMERPVGIEIEGKRYCLENCKIIADFSDTKFPFYYGILVNKITDFNF